MTKNPFDKSIRHQQELLGISVAEAMDRTQRQYENFKNRNDSLLNRQLDKENDANIQLISHFALLATLVLTVVGFLITQGIELTKNQQTLILMIFLAQIVSLTLGAYDFIQTIRFHRGWAYLHHAIDEEVNKALDAGKIQLISDLAEIENKHYESAPVETNVKVTIAMVSSCIFGLVLMFVLFIAYFYDLPCG